MPMQPSPRAETSRLLFPSLRFCIVPPGVFPPVGSSGPVLLVADLFHPVHGLAVELFLNGDVRHGGGRPSAVPMLLTRWKPDHVTGPDVLGWRSPALRETTASRHEQRLTKRVRV